MTSKKWFTADTHFYHKNIITFCNRPYKNADHMNREMIYNWNRIVSKEDDVYILGDVAMMGNDKWQQLAAVTKKLNGRLHLIYGNHDRLSPKNYEKCGFFSVHYPYLILENGWILVHDPALSVTCPENTVILSGHVHDQQPFLSSIEKRIVFNVGVDVNGFEPVAETTIIEEIMRVKGI